MKAPPPKITPAILNTAADRSTLKTRANDPNGTWNLAMGAFGYWIPNAINRSASYRHAIRGLR